MLAISSAPNTLSPDMTLDQFHNGYWYATDLRKFAEQIHVPGAIKLRKDELTETIEHFLKTGKREPVTKRKLRPTGPKDSARLLHMDTPVKRYTNDAQTKKFLLDEARKINPEFKIRSGTRYTLNRWREDQMAQGKTITYGDLVHKLMALGASDTPASRAKGTYYMYFLSDYLADGAGTRDEGIKAWHELKKMDVPKTYAAWKAAQSQ